MNNRPIKKIALALCVFAFLFMLPISTQAGTKLEVVKFKHNAPGNDNKNAKKEYFTVRNISSKTLNMRKWRVRDDSSHKLVLQKLKLKPGQKLSVYSGKGNNKLTGKRKKVYWNNGMAIWNNSGDILYIRNRKKKRALKYTYK